MESVAPKTDDGESPKESVAPLGVEYAGATCTGVALTAVAVCPSEFVAVAVTWR